MSNILKSAESGKIAEIIGGNQYAINIGKDQGVSRSDRYFVVRARRIEDPDSKEDLGEVLLTTDELEVSQVFPKFSIVRKVSGVLGIELFSLTASASQPVPDIKIGDMVVKKDQPRQPGTSGKAEQ